MRLLMLFLSACLASAVETDPFLALISTAPVIDEVPIANADPGHRFIEMPAQASTIGSAGGVATRLLPNSAGPRMFAIRLGEGRNLQAKATYVLEVDVVEDAPRAFFIINRGDDTLRGICAGSALPDTLYQFTSTNPEVLDVPLAKGVRTWRSVFRLHQRFSGLQRTRDMRQPLGMTPADGFWVVIAQVEPRRNPGSRGAAVAAIRLRHIADPSVLSLKLNRPPKDLPWRHAFWREEMADGVVTATDPSARGLDDPIDWYDAKLQTMRMLGIDVFCKDLLEFGHNQGWDSAPYGGSDWVNQANDPKLWERIVAHVGKAGFPILPYYEYAGSVGQKTGLGSARRTRPLGDKRDYTHSAWLEKHSADISDPDILVDFTRIAELTVLRLRTQAEFLGVWLRPRHSGLPMSFSDATLARFAASIASPGVTREQLRADTTLLQRYYGWWFLQRRAFLTGVRDALRAGGLPAAQVLYTAYPNEPAPELPEDALVVQGDTTAWSAVLEKPRPLLDWTAVANSRQYLDRVLGQPTTWGGWETHHSFPQADPQNYSDADGVMMTFPFNRAYTVWNQGPGEAFRTRSGTAYVRHQSLNETVMPSEMIGYHCVDMERSGPACMLSEVASVAHGDPGWLGNLAGTSFTTGYPQHVRAFYAAYMALPALPGRIVPDAASAKQVVVRAFDGGRHGTWLAVANLGFDAAPQTRVILPVGGAVSDASNGQTIPTADGSITLNLAPCSLSAIRIAPQP
jgi:hypothetical protein